jgi:hypothetical protein
VASEFFTRLLVDDKAAFTPYIKTTQYISLAVQQFYFLWVKDVDMLFTYFSLFYEKKNPYDGENEGIVR